MTAIHANEFLLAQFQDFYTEVIRLKQLIKASGGMSAVDVLPAETGESNTSLALVSAFDSVPAAEQTKLTVLVWQNLIALFRRNAVQVLRAAGKPTDNYFEAQYVMAALADDVFIHLDWEGRRAWMSNLLESTLFQSHVAGELFFEKLDRLLRDRDPVDRGLAAIYLSALSLGFRGKYHGLNDHGQLRCYRQELFTFVFRQPPDLTSDAKVAFPDSYVSNLRKEKRKKLSNPRVWLAVLGFVVVIYVAASHGVWLRLTSRLEHVNNEIVETEKRLAQIPPTN
jgi:type VI secretion system protein ImpK